MITRKHTELSVGLYHTHSRIRLRVDKIGNAQPKFGYT